jgi:membrane fusion protein, multidrug efflux system
MPNTDTRPRRAWKLWLVLLIVAIALGLGVTRALQKRSAKQASAAEAAAQLQQAPVFALAASDVLTARSQTVQQVVPVSGALRALQTAVIKARVAGELQGVSKREGDAVRAGEVLARVDPTEGQARVRQAEQQAQAALAQVQIAQRTLSNNQALVGQGFISATTLETAQSNLAATEANHRAAQAALDIARKALADAVLTAPFAGQVSARLAHNGERVGVDARILELIDTSAFELEAALTPADAAAVQVGQAVTLRVEGLAQPLAARVKRISPSVQPGSRSVLVYLQVAPAPGLRQGLFAQGHIVVVTARGVAVPQSAVRNDKPQPYVQLVEQGKVVHRTVALSSSGLAGEPAEPVWLLTELSEGAVVLRAQAGLIREGTEVRLPDHQR